ncbi:MAG: tRNA lysidine(34) synthetase TilS [Candidatus Omnitrophota bacterium]
MPLNKFLETIKKFDLISYSDGILVGVSGGPDSIALLYLLNDLKVKLGLRILVAHLNHGVRGRQADLDEEFVEKTSRKLNLDFISKKINLPKAKRYSEENLRKLRYDFLFDSAKLNKITKIALAHNLDDQAETVLMRLIRGTGLYGLISMLAKRKIGYFTIIRPLIEVPRSEIEGYLKKVKVKPRIDNSNFNQGFLRNRIRHGILNDLAKINPNIRQVLARFAQQAAIDYDYLYRNSIRFVDRKSNFLVKIELKKILKLHTALQRMVVRIAFEDITGGLRSFTNKHWEEMQELIKIRPNKSIVNLSKGAYAKKEAKHLLICKK